jgi:xanthine/uracil permease
VSGVDVVGAAVAVAVVVGAVAIAPASSELVVGDVDVVGCGITTLLFGVCAEGPSQAIASVAIAAAPAAIAIRRTPQKGHALSVLRQWRWHRWQGVSFVMR